MLPAAGPDHRHHSSQHHLLTMCKEPSLPTVPVHHSLGMEQVPWHLPSWQLCLLSIPAPRNRAQNTWPTVISTYSITGERTGQVTSTTAVMQLSPSNALIKAGDFNHKSVGLTNEEVSNHTNLAAFVGYMRLLKGMEEELHNNKASLFTPVIKEVEESKHTAISASDLGFTQVPIIIGPFSAACFIWPP